MTILNRLKNLEQNLIKTGKPNAAKVCSDARDEIIRLRSQNNNADHPLSGLFR